MSNLEQEETEGFSENYKVIKKGFLYFAEYFG
jgi:hypothetical protein